MKREVVGYYQGTFYTCCRRQRCIFLSWSQSVSRDPLTQMEASLLVAAASGKVGEGGAHHCHNVLSILIGQYSFFT